MSCGCQYNCNCNPCRTTTTSTTTTTTLCPDAIPCDAVYDLNCFMYSGCEDDCPQISTGDSLVQVFANMFEMIVVQCGGNPSGTTTTTTIAIPPGAIQYLIVLGYETISPVEDIIVSNTLEDLCIAFSNLINFNINLDSVIFDETTYYLDEETMLLYNSVTNTFAEDGYYFSEGSLLVIDGLAESIDPYEVCGITTTTTTTP
jgi:hypothetical protein